MNGMGVAQCTNSVHPDGKLSIFVFIGRRLYGLAPKEDGADLNQQNGHKKMNAILPTGEDKVPPAFSSITMDDIQGINSRRHSNG